MSPEPTPTPPDRFADSPDPLVDEVREARRWVGEQQANDLRRHIDALRRIQQEWGAPIISDRGDPARRAL